jgi:hypothetical protein
MFASAYMGDRDGADRISHCATLDRAPCAAFTKESRMECFNAAKLHGKPGQPLTTLSRWNHNLFSNKEELPNTPANEPPQPGSVAA